MGGFNFSFGNGGYGEDGGRGGGHISSRIWLLDKPFLPIPFLKEKDNRKDIKGINWFLKEKLVLRCFYSTQIPIQFYIG